MYGKTSLLQRNIKVFVRVGGYGALSTGEAYFDNIKLEEVKDVPAGAVVHSLKKPKTENKAKTTGLKFMAPSLLITFIMVLLFMLLKNKLYSDDGDEKHLNKKAIFWAVILIGAAIRVILSVLVRGYPNDISCWLGWSSACNQYGLFKRLPLRYFPGLPAGIYVYTEHTGFIMRILGNIPDRLSWLIVKIPPLPPT